MVDPRAVVEYLRNQGISFYTGVPDSVLMSFCSYLERLPPTEHVLCHNEGGAIALAVGKYLASGQPALVYMQNSGQGNSLNPIVSLAVESVYGIPMVLLVGWRGEPGGIDEPQHALQGTVTKGIYQLMGCTVFELPQEQAGACEVLGEAVRIARGSRGPVVVLVRRGTFLEGGGRARYDDPEAMTRIEAVCTTIGSLSPTDCVITGTGEISREALQVAAGDEPITAQVFPNVGAMGHASQVALGVALCRGRDRVFCLDGDGAVLMHLGAIATIGKCRPSNLVHVLLNNGAHVSVGGQATGALEIDFLRIAAACGYRWWRQVSRKGDLQLALDDLKRALGPFFLEVRVSCSPARGLPRPKESLRCIGDRFSKFLASVCARD